jgi:hypothetical protein
VEKRREEAAGGAAAPRAAQLAAAKPAAGTCAVSTLAAATLAAPRAVQTAAVKPSEAACAAATLAAAKLADPTPEVAAPAAAMHAAVTLMPASREVVVSTAAWEHSKLAVFERRASSRSLVLARRSKDSQPGTPENLCCAEEEALNFDISLDLEDRESVFSPAPGDGASQMGKCREAIAGSEEGGTDEQEKREIEADLEKLAERLVATLSAACSRMKKRRQSDRQ